jgi:hypothetical protein
MNGCFFGRRPPPEIAFLLRVLDCSDLMELAGMYGEARERYPELKAAVNKRMEEVIKLHNLATRKAADGEQGAKPS